MTYFETTINSLLTAVMTLYSDENNSLTVFFTMKLRLYIYFIFQQDNTQNIKAEGQQGSEALTAARNKKCLEQILATT